ncbi:hypothetical protein ANN_04780 [Periplaneta americana]|uniref:Uncharacterized protein n=1 Tax=Periplaneta americana TaxID=6978 RepID=A0ABQ8TBS8_PERAM|nr:hypothetical protein ANN_04780 [Periplaneta americana]
MTRASAQDYHVDALVRENKTLSVVSCENDSEPCDDADTDEGDGEVEVFHGNTDTEQEGESSGDDEQFEIPKKVPRVSGFKCKDGTVWRQHCSPKAVRSRQCNIVTHLPEGNSVHRKYVKELAVGLTDDHLKHRAALTNLPREVRERGQEVAGTSFQQLRLISFQREREKANGDACTHVCDLMTSYDINIHSQHYPAASHSPETFSWLEYSIGLDKRLTTELSNGQTGPHDLERRE